MSARRLSIAIGVGVGIELVLLLFGLHVSLWLATVTAGNLRVYWMLNGVYLVAGIATGLILVRWSSVAVRAVTAIAILLLGAAVGLISAIR
jgi:hypothetical protein